MRKNWQPSHFLLVLSLLISFRPEVVSFKCVQKDTKKMLEIKLIDTIFPCWQSDLLFHLIACLTTFRTKTKSYQHEIGRGIQLGRNYNFWLKYMFNSRGDRTHIGQFRFFPHISLPLTQKKFFSPKTCGIVFHTHLNFFLIFS